MDLPNIFSKLTSKEKPQEQFLAIEIGQESVTTAIWQVVDGETQIVKLGTTEDWEAGKETIDSLLTAIDTSLEKSLADLAAEPNKVIFGLQQSWVEGKAITKKYTKILKQIAEKFEFDPIGFVVTTEAIIHLLKNQEGIPPTAILIRINESEIHVTLVNLGKITGSQTVSRSEDIGADVEEGLARFENQEQFPSRMLLWNSNFDLESLKQDLLSYNWLEKLPFLHFPKVEILEKQIAIKAVTIAGGAEAAKALGLEIKKEEEATPQEPEPEAKEAQVREEEKEEFETSEIPTAEDIGFKLEEDVAEKLPSQEPEEKPEKETIVETEEKEEMETVAPEKRAFRSKLRFLQFLSPRAFTFPRPKLPDLGNIMGSRVKIAFGIAIAFFLTLSAVAFYGYWVVPKAELILYVKPKTLDKELMITIDPSASQLNAIENLIPGREVEIQVEGGKEKQTTGTRLVGEKASSEVTIYNKTSQAKTFPAGALLVGPSNLVFALDTSVTVASASSQESDEAVTTTFGKSQVTVTASQIGAQYNISPNTDLTFKDFSSASFAAKNEQEFTGGTSREVQAIEQQDIDDLIGVLTDELTLQAARDLEAQEGGDRKVLVDGAKTQVVSQEISGEVGDEAQSVSAKLVLKVITFSYSKDDFSEILRQAVVEAIPENYQLHEEESQIEIREAEIRENVANIAILYKAVLIPRIDEDEIKRNLVGRYPKVAQDYLESLPDFSKAEVKISPQALPAKLKTFPRRADNITIRVEVEGSS